MTEVQVSTEPKSYGLATASLVLGIIGIVFSWIIYLGLPLDVLAIIFGAIGLNKAKTEPISNKGLAKAGLICGIIGLVFAILLIVVGVLLFASFSSQLQNLPK